MKNSVFSRSILPLVVSWPAKGFLVPGSFLRCSRVVGPSTCKVLVNSELGSSIFAVEHRGSFRAPIHCRPKSFTCLASVRVTCPSS